MPLDRSIRRYSGRKLAALYDPLSAHEFPVNLASATRFVMGRLLGQYTTTANDVQTLTVTGTPTGGSLTIRAWHPASGASGTFVLPYNASAATAQTLIRALLGNHITVTGGPLPGSALVFTASGAFVNMPLTLMTIELNALTGGATPGGGATIVKTTHGRSRGTYGLFTPGNADGTQIARAIMSYECTTDTGGNITFGPVAIDGYHGETFPDAPAYTRGYFDTKEIVGDIAAAITSGFGRIHTGSVADGVYWIP